MCGPNTKSVGLTYLISTNGSTVDPSRKEGFGATLDPPFLLDACEDAPDTSLAPTIVT